MGVGAPEYQFQTPQPSVHLDTRGPLVAAERLSDHRIVELLDDPQSNGLRLISWQAIERFHDSSAIGLDLDPRHGSHRLVIDRDVRYAEAVASFP
ncbi:MAG: hypothetical protein OSA99_14970 [Acidimicrobiales bacterium]|nr:hypothetical protein [Acidimicrobiales bacterium]